MANPHSCVHTSFLPTDIDLLRRYIDLGIRDVFSVPCSITDTWTRLALAAARQREWNFHLTNHEGNLAGLAAGVYLGTGRTALVHLQNSGLPNIGDGLISMASPRVSGIPVALLVTHRGADTDDDSEPHQEIGRRTDALVEAILGEPANSFGAQSGADILSALEQSIAAAQRGGIGVLKLSEKAFMKSKVPAAGFPYGDISRPRPTDLRGVKGILSCDPRLRFAKPICRDDAISAIADAHPDAASLYCNGYTARAARMVADRPGNFYNVGYMGGTLAIGWSLAKCRPDLEVVVVDGDQNVLMSTMKEHLWSDYPANLHWYILNNQIGASVGGAPSLPIPPTFHDLARVIEIVPDTLGSFQHPRVAASQAHFSQDPPEALAGRLSSLTWRFRQWAASPTATASVTKGDLR